MGNQRVVWFLLGMLAPLLARAGDVAAVRHEFRPAPDMDRAEVYTLATVKKPAAALVLCPGCNGSGEELILQPEWREFAQKHRLALLGISFSSPIELHSGDSRRGYYHASQGSGQILLDAVEKTQGRKLPLLLYGFSGGAHFTSRFAEWKPERVKAWCAYSAAWWDEPAKRKRMPPGLIACGDHDGERYGASLVFFKQGRALGKPWLWVSLPRVEHAVSAPFEDFVRNYFAAVLNTKAIGRWVDVDEKQPVGGSDAKRNASVTGWLPDEGLIKEWGGIHEP